jgi:hypothetical protein
MILTTFPWRTYRLQLLQRTPSNRLPVGSQDGSPENPQKNRIKTSANEKRRKTTKKKKKKNTRANNPIRRPMTGGRGG